MGAWCWHFRPPVGPPTCALQIAFVALLGTVTLEVALVARYWTWLFGVLTVLSYVLVYPFMVIFPLAGAHTARVLVGGVASFHCCCRCCCHVLRRPAVGMSPLQPKHFAHAPPTQALAVPPASSA